MNVTSNPPGLRLIRKGESVAPVVNIEDLQALGAHPVVGQIDIIRTNGDDQGIRTEI